jgi:hypothetical protein
MKILVILLLATASFAQTAPKRVSEHAIVQILTAEHDLDQANLTKANAQSQFVQLQNAYKQADDKATAANKALNEAIDSAKTECGKDQSFDPANFTCVAKPAPTVKK